MQKLSEVPSLNVRFYSSFSFGRIFSESLVTDSKVRWGWSKKFLLHEFTRPEKSSSFKAFDHVHNFFDKIEYMEGFFPD